MSVLDNQKDFYIKEKLQKDMLISKKADDVFNNFLKEDLKVNEENSNKLNSNDSNLNTKENKKEKSNKKYKKLIATAASILVLFGAANVYAMTQGYENIFFMIKYLTTGEPTTITNRSEILSDRDITISFEPIKLTEKLELQVKNLQIKDNEAKLFLVVNEKTLEEDTNVVPLEYKVYNKNDELLCSYESVKKDYLGQSMYTEELVLNNFKESDKVLKLEVYRADSKLITTLKIDLENKTIEVAGEEEALEKISEIELKEFLSYPSLLYNSQTNEMVNDSGKIWGAIITSIYLDCELDRFSFEISTDKYENLETYGYRVDDINLILNDVFGMYVEELDDNGENDFKVYEENGIKYFVTTYAGGLPSPSECIDITNISYCGGLYTVTYTYCELGSYGTIFDVDINNCNIYEQTITFELNKDDTISKFRMVSSQPPVVIKSADENEEGVVDEEVIIPTKPEHDDNIVDEDDIVSNKDKEIVEEYFSGKWYSYFAGNILRIKNDMTFTVEFNDEIIDRGTIELKYYSDSEVPHIIFKYDNGNVYDYERRVTGEVSLQSGDNEEVYEARTKEDDENTSENKPEEIKVDNYASTMSWTEYYAPGIKIKYPTIFNLEEIGGYYRGNRSGEISTLISGVATGVDPDTKEIINSNMTIEIYEPTYKAMSMEEIEELEEMCKYIRADGTIWYENYQPDGNGGATYTHTSYIVDVNNPTYSAWEYRVVFKTDIDANYKVINIINWFLKSTDVISY